MKSFYIYAVLAVVFLTISGMFFLLPIAILGSIHVCYLFKKMTEFEVYKCMGIIRLQNMFKNCKVITELTEE